jgi:hypothetical protein
MQAEHGSELSTQLKIGLTSPIQTFTENAFNRITPKGQLQLC